MGRVKSKGKHTRADALAALAASAKPAEPTYTTPELLLKAGGLMASQDFELAKKFCERAVELAAKGKHAKHSTEAFEMLGTVELELGELDEAREVRLRCSCCTVLRPSQTVPPGGRHTLTPPALSRLDRARCRHRGPLPRSVPLPGAALDARGIARTLLECPFDPAGQAGRH